MNDAELNGKVDGFVATLLNTSNAPLLTTAKAPVTEIVAALTAKKTALITKSAEQQTLKATLKSKTLEVAAASTGLYDEFTSRIYAVAGLVGKKSPLGEQILKLRSDLLRSGGSRSTGTSASVSSSGGEEASAPVPLPNAA